MAAGITDRVWQTTTPRELSLLLTKRAEIEEARQKRDDMRAGLVAAAIYNVNRAKKTDRVWSPADFFRDDDSHVVKPEVMEQRLLAWARRHNRAVDA